MKDNMRILICFLAGLIFFIMISPGCSKSKTAAPVTPVVLKLGDSYQGGIIFFLDASGKHGLIAATMDQSKSTPWWNGSFVSIGVANTVDGSANTTTIIQVQGNSTNYAAKICRDYRGGGYTDWFLPAKDQLNTLYNQKVVVGGFTDDIYWSSTEFDVGSVWVQYFLNGLQHLDNTSDGATVGTRAIRSF